MVSGAPPIADPDLFHLRRDYERLVLSGHKRTADEAGRAILDAEQQTSLARLIESGLAAHEGPAFVLRSVRDAELLHERVLSFDAETRETLDQLYALWLRLDDDTATSGDEILYGELGYWQHWWNVLNDGTDRRAEPLRMDVMLPEQGGFLSRQWTHDMDPQIVEHVFSQQLVSIRVIVPPATRGSNAETLIEAATGLGVQVRVFPSTSEFSLYDGAIALVRDENRLGEPERHRLTRRRSMVDPLNHLFELRWAASVPWDSFVRGSGGILQLMAQGWTDTRIAAALDVSPRTVSRRIAEMMASAGVQSRFELGMKYALHEFGPHVS